ncbi:MAG: hypothetical protein LBP87_00140 [Planctomycetaceae bacterium]|nr:hypothetical protein [Planctomycetaceae bacterium]
MKFIEHYFMNRIDHALDHAQPLAGWTAWYVRRNPKLWEYYTKMLKLELELRFPNTEINNKSNENINNVDNVDNVDNIDNIDNVDNINDIIFANRRNYYLNDQPNSQQISQSKNTKIRRRNYWFTNRAVISAAAIFLVSFMILSFFIFPKQKKIETGTPIELTEDQKTEVQKTEDQKAGDQKTKDQKIDLANILDGLFFAAAPLAELVPSIENPFAIPFESPFEISAKSSVKNSAENPIQNPIQNSFESSLLKFPVEPIVRFTDCPLESTLTFLETAGVVRSSNHEPD